jgi:hypothetical protein
LVGDVDGVLEKAKFCKQESLLVGVEVEEDDVLELLGVVVTEALPFFEVDDGDDFTGLDEGVVGAEPPESWYS